MSLERCPACLGARGSAAHPVCPRCFGDAQLVPTDLRHAWLKLTGKPVRDVDEFVHLHRVIVRSARTARRHRIIGARR